LADRVLGYSVRASSLEGDRLRECYRQIEPLLYYYLPRDCPAEAKLQHTASSAPKRLVYVPSSDGWEILFHACYRQTDTVGRPGSYFAHILARDAAKQPGPWSVLDCLRLWEAPHWVTEDSSNIPLVLKPLRSLQEMLGDGCPGIDDGLMLSFLTTEANGSFHDPRKLIPERWCQKPVEERRQVFSALLSGLLGVLPHRYERALIAVEPGLAALLFYGILRLVPRRVLPKDTSFSTYEPKPDRKRFSLVATCFADPQATDLMRDWCNPADFVLNTYSGRGGPSQECMSPYAEFMADRLLHQGWEGVDELIRRVDDLPHGHLVDLDRLAESERANAALPVAVPPASPQPPAVSKPPPAIDDKIDPHHEWLGIPPRDQPPHYYRLLGIIAFESNPTLIENAACNRIDRLRAFLSGQHSALSQRLIHEVEAAKVCLLDPAKKAAYDQQLKVSSRKAKRPSPSATAPALLTSILPPLQPDAGTKEPRANPRSLPITERKLSPLPTGAGQRNSDSHPPRSPFALGSSLREEHGEGAIMTPEVEEMVAALKNEGVSFYQAKVVIDSIAELSGDEKREALRQFIPADKPNATSPIPPPAITTERIYQQTAERLCREAASFLVKYKLIVWVIVLGLVMFFSYFALWAIARFLERLIMRI
jgi:hypothetical protein